MTRRTPTTRQTDRKKAVLAHLETLGVLVSETELDHFLREGEKAGWSHLELLEHLFGEQAAAKRERTIARRIREAGLPGDKSLEMFDWQFNARAIDRVQIEELATGEFVRRGDNLLMIGQSGIGKSHLLEGAARRICTHGYRVRYVASDELLADLGASLADGTMPKRIRYYTRFDLLVIDGFGFDKIERQEVPQALSLLFKVVDKRNARSSTALISNIDLDLWNEYLGDAPMVMALIDRLMERAIIMRFRDAKSYRANSARQVSPTGTKPAAGGGKARSQASRKPERRKR